MLMNSLKVDCLSYHFSRRLEYFKEIAIVLPREFIKVINLRYAFRTKYSGDNFGCGGC